MLTELPREDLCFGDSTSSRSSSSWCLLYLPKPEGLLLFFALDLRDCRECDDAMVESIEKEDGDW